MTSKERVRAVMQHQRPDRIPAEFECVHTVEEKLFKHYGFTDPQQLLLFFVSSRTFSRLSGVFIIVGECSQAMFCKCIYNVI